MWQVGDHISGYGLDRINDLYRIGQFAQVISGEVASTRGEPWKITHLCQGKFQFVQMLRYHGGFRAPACRNHCSLRKTTQSAPRYRHGIRRRPSASPTHGPTKQLTESQHSEATMAITLIQRFHLSVRPPSSASEAGYINHKGHSADQLIHSEFSAV